MRITRTVAVVAVGVGMTASGLLLNDAWSNPAPTVVPSATTTPLPTDAVAIHAANRAALVMLCEAGLSDPAAQATYRATAAAHPDIAAGIGNDCSLVAVQP